MPRKGLFIVLEGITGSGKSTQAFQLGEWLLHQTRKLDTVVVTREYTGSEFGQKIHHAIMKRSDDPQGDKERLMEWYVLDREQHVDTIIAPALLAGAVVVCDRYKYSTIAYQGAQGLPVSRLIEENKGFPIPDLVLILNASPEKALARTEGSGKEMDKFEKLAFQEKVREFYVKMPSLFPNENIQVINANQDVATVQKDIIRAIKPLVDLIAK